MSNHGLQSPKRPFDNLNRLANFNGGIDSHDFFRTHSRLKPDHNIFRQGCQAISKADDPSNSVRTFDGAMLFRIDKFREQIARKHRLYEPDWLIEQRRGRGLRHNTNYGIWESQVPKKSAKYL